MEYWKNKACLITGGSAGLGLVLAEVLTRHGAKVVLNGRNSDRLDAASTQLE
ncbi:MAG: SDR family NAD(P)-dependent oxidoreductase, partial [Aeoliella sp.]